MLFICLQYFLGVLGILVCCTTPIGTTSGFSFSPSEMRGGSAFISVPLVALAFKFSSSLEAFSLSRSYLMTFFFKDVISFSRFSMVSFNFLTSFSLFCLS
eukprot:NODE_205_length_12934_cov_1.115933.p7 type:complete len:100 gc:universal NODE_205_length_12934_cov_1.115933:6154-5855(-)